MLFDRKYAYLYFFVNFQCYSIGSKHFVIFPCYSMGSMHFVIFPCYSMGICELKILGGEKERKFTPMSYRSSALWGRCPKSAWMRFLNSIFILKWDHQVLLHRGNHSKWIVEFIIVLTYVHLHVNPIAQSPSNITSRYFESGVGDRAMARVDGTIVFVKRSDEGESDLVWYRCCEPIWPEMDEDEDGASTSATSTAALSTATTASAVVAATSTTFKTKTKARSSFSVKILDVLKPEGSRISFDISLEERSDKSSTSAPRFAFEGVGVGDVIGVAIKRITVKVCM